jgi:probable HAF family extracellular repeat protein
MRIRTVCTGSLALVLVSAGFVAIPAAVGAATPAFVYHSLAPGAHVSALNLYGDVVGDQNGHAVRWDRHGVRTDLGTLGGFNSGATAINDAGQIAGSADLGGVATHAFRWDPAAHKMTDLGTLGGTNSHAYGINKSGQVVGISETTSGGEHGFVWNPSTKLMTDLGTLGGPRSQANAINDAGQIVGDATTKDGLSHAFLWNPSTKSMKDLGVLPGTIVSFAYDINNRGDIVGVAASVGDNSQRAFIWTLAAPTMRAVGKSDEGPSEALAINDKGNIAGTTQQSGGSASRAAIWGRAVDRVTPLPQIKGLSSGASDVNNSLQVIGYAGGAAAYWTYQ